MTRTKLQSYQACEEAVSKHSMLGIQTCSPGMLPKEEQAADGMLTGAAGGCPRNNGRMGNYLCPIKGGMLELCKVFLGNGDVLSCETLVPSSTDEILKRGGCTGNGGVYACPSDMMGLCDVYLKNGVILSCKQK